MTPEEPFERIERLLEFLARNQAQLSADVGSLTQSVSSLKLDLVELARIVQQHVVTTEKRFQMVADQFLRVDKSLETMAETQRITGDRLNSLILVVERYYSDGRH